MTQPTTSLSYPFLRGSLFYLTFFISSGAFIPFLNVYFLQLGLTGSQVGILAAIFPLGILALATPISALADRRRRRVRILQGALAGVAVFLFALGYARSFIGLLGVMVLIAIFFSPVLSIADSVISRMAERRGLNFGSMRLFGSIGFSTSAAVSGFLWLRFGYQPMFLVGALAFIPVILISGAQEEGPLTSEQERQPVSEIARDRGLMGLLLATFLVGIALSLGLAFEGILMDSLGGSQALIGLLGASQAIMELPTMRYGTALARRLNGPKTLLIGYAFIGGAFLSYALAQNPIMLLLVSTLKGAGFGLLYTVTIRTINLRAPAEWSATAISLMTVGIFGLAPIIASPLGGLVLDAFGARAIFIGATLAAGLGAVVLSLSAARYKLS